ncbi:MAG: hypothetical protein A2138_01010 [Deltaproteobacteria bacterium RBG_16_71_12]|nr:MAG: hypothetical protein A2138_01010 [Deltaproteobacteria bacterium RBG_16_71_12]
MGARSKDERMVSQVRAALAQLLEVEPGEVSVRSNGASAADLVVSAAGATFVVEWTTSASAAPVAATTKKAAQHAKALRKRAIPLVAVPFMGEAGGGCARMLRSRGST